MRAVGVDVLRVRGPLEAGARAFLDACTDQQRIQISLLDAPTVLGWPAWREIAQRHTLGLVKAALAQAMDADALARQDIQPLAHILVGALCEAALFIANAERPDIARRDVEPVLLSLVYGLRTPAS